MDSPGGNPKCTLIAILDDYFNIALPHFTSLPGPQTSISVYQETFPAWTHPTTTSRDKSAIVERLKRFTIISTMRERTPFPRELLEQLPNLQLLLCTGTQFETFDIEAASEFGIIVAAAPGRGRTDSLQPPRKPYRCHPATAHTWALILGLARNIATHDCNIKLGGWQTNLAVGLEGKTLGICGLGRLGASAARMAIVSFGMKVICWSKNLTQEKADEMARRHDLPTEDVDDGLKTFQVVSHDELFKCADVLSLHYVLSDRTKGLVGASDLKLMKPDAMLINTSRGALIDEPALLDTLIHGRIRGAALDTFDIEPLPLDSPWRTIEWGKNGSSQVLLSPHMGYVEDGLMHTWYDETAENVERWLKGQEVLHRLN